MPILVTGWFSLNQWRQAGEELAQIDAAMEPVTAAHTAFEMFDRLGRAELVIEAAALPEAPEAIIDLAVREQALVEQDLPGIIQEFSENVAAFSVQLGQSDEVTMTLLETSTSLAGTAIRQHEVGEPAPAVLDLVLRPSRDGLFDMSPVMLRTSVEDVVEEEQLLRELMRLDHTHDLDLLLSLRGTANPDALMLSEMRLPTWDPDLGEWTLDLQPLPGSPSITELMEFGSLATEDNPLAPPLLTLAAVGTEPSAERDVALLDAFENDLSLRGQRIEAYEAFTAAADAKSRSLRRGRLVAAISGLTMTGLALALLWLVIGEVRERRRVATAHQQTLAGIAEQANSDALTGLRNRRWLDEELPRLLDGRSADEEVVIAYLDVDRFKMINDVWGHHNGDLILQVVAERLRGAAEAIPGMEIVRFGGDEFVAIATMSAAASDHDLDAIGAGLLRVFDAPVTIDSKQHDIESSIGVAMSNADSTVHTLLVDADLSMLQAKRSGRGRVVVDKRGSGRVGELVQVIPQAIAANEFSMDLQPVVDVATGAVRHYEALARWTRSTGEEISPAVFVPLVESFGLADDLTEAMLRNVAGLLGEQGPGFPRIWINVSPVEFNGPDLSGRILRRLRTLGIAPASIGIEMTERSAIGDVVGVEDELAKLRSHGVQIAIDDFGAGYSPLGHLRDLPVDILKIDRSLIASIDRDQGAQQIVRGIAGFARSLGLTLVAEGVERPEELEFLRAEGIDLVQGWLIGGPGPADTMLRSEAKSVH